MGTAVLFNFVGKWQIGFIWKASKQQVGEGTPTKKKEMALWKKRKLHKKRRMR